MLEGQRESFHGEAWSGWKKAGKELETGIKKRQSKENELQRKQETLDAVGTIISGNTERNLLGEGWAAAAQDCSVEDHMFSET